MPELDLADVTYHGHRPHGGGAAVIEVLDAAGDSIGVVRHVVRHSPTGMQWGYAGSGPADCARSLLIAALGEEAARCPTCRGARRVIYDPELDIEEPYEPDGKHSLINGDNAYRCHCEDGYRSLPYQDFKFEVIARLDQQQWTMTRAAILDWYANHGGTR